MTSFAAEARRTYNIDQWGSGYFDVGQDGLTLVRPHGEPGTPAPAAAGSLRRYPA